MSTDIAAGVLLVSSIIAAGILINPFFTFFGLFLFGVWLGVA